jgi:hypothetical protein
MAKYNEVLTLRSVSHEETDTGAIVDVVNDVEVFFNRYTMSIENRLAGAADGFKGLVTGQVRTCDYAGQQIALIGNTKYTVTDAQNSGEFTTLTMAEKLSNTAGD